MTNLDRLQATKTLYCQLLPVIEMAAATPTQANIDAALAAINSTAYAGVLVHKPSTQQDSESYDWVGYKKALLDGIEQLNRLIQAESLPWIARSRARP